MATGDATWMVGTVTVPSSSGTQTVTGLGGTPDAVFFWGTNWLTEDTAVTTRGCGLFRGMCAPQWDSPGTLLQNSACVLPAGDAHDERNSAVHVLDTSGGSTTLYEATVSSLDADGFTLSWSTGASGGYKVVYAALMDTQGTMETGAYVGGSTTLSLGWKGGSSLLHGSWGGPVSSGSDRTQEFYGGGAYPTDQTFDWESAGLTSFTFPTAYAGQFNIGIQTDGPAISIAMSGSFSGPFLQAQNVVAYPSGGSLTDFVFSTNEVNNAGMVVVWDDEDSRTGHLTLGASQGNTAAVSGLPFHPGLVVGYSISDEPIGQGTGAHGAVGFSVVAPGFQWTALVDMSAVGYPDAYGFTETVGAFQSFQRGVCSRVENSNVHAATIELTDDGFVATTEEDDVTPSDWVWHAFGHPQPLRIWVPHIYRRVFSTSVVAEEPIDTIVVTTGTEGSVGAVGSGSLYFLTGFVLLENGDQIILEDGSGFLLL